MTDAELLYAVQNAAAGEYEVLGEVGRIDEGTIVFLARELATATVVMMRLEPSGRDVAGVPQFSLDVLRELDESVPQLDSPCPRCAKPLRKWARFCTKCGQDVSGVSPSTSGSSVTRTGLRQEAERVAAGTGYQFIGGMPRAAGGGDVYFARDPQTNRIVALRLTKEAGRNFELAATGMMAPVAPPPPPPPGANAPAAGTVGIIPGPSVRTSTTHRVPADALAAQQRAASALASSPELPPKGPEPSNKRSVPVVAIVVVVASLAAVAYIVASR